MVKEKKRRKPVNLTTYLCEVCGAEHVFSGDATNCEKSHTCEHEAFFKFDDASEDRWWFNVRGISATCAHCNKDLGRVEFEAFSDDQVFLRKVFDLAHDGGPSE